MKEQHPDNSGISLRDLWVIFKRNLVLIAIVTFVFTLAGAIYGFKFKKTTYRATSQAIVMIDTQTPGSGQSDNYQNFVYSTSLINTFVDFIKIDTVIDYTHLELKDKYPELTKKGIRDSISISTKTESLVINITCSSYNEELSIDLANTLLKKTMEVAKTNDVDNPTELKYPVLANKFKDINLAKSATGTRGASVVIMICFMLGLILSYGFGLIKYLCDDTYHSKEDFEALTGIKLLAVIPYSKELTTDNSKEVIQHE